MTLSNCNCASKHEAPRDAQSVRCEKSSLKVPPVPSREVFKRLRLTNKNKGSRQDDLAKTWREAQSRATKNPATTASFKSLVPLCGPDRSRNLNVDGGTRKVISHGCTRTVVAHASQPFNDVLRQTFTCGRVCTEPFTWLSSLSISSEVGPEQPDQA